MKNQTQINEKIEELQEDAEKYSKEIEHLKKAKEESDSIKDRNSLDINIDSIQYKMDYSLGMMGALNWVIKDN